MKATNRDGFHDECPRCGGEMILHGDAFLNLCICPDDDEGEDALEVSMEHPGALSNLAHDA